MPPATDIIAKFVRDFPRELLPYLDITVAWVWRPEIPLPGRFSARIEILCSNLGRPKITAQAEATTIESALAAAILKLKPVKEKKK